MPVLWPQRYDSAITAPSLRRSPREHSSSPGVAYLVSTLVVRFAIDEVIELERHVVPGSGTFVSGDMQEQVAEREELRQALAQLNADQRRVVALRYGADLTEADIALVLGWPVGTVKSRLNRARERLRVLLTSESG